MGHEFCGEILEVGEKWKHKYRAGDRFVIQPALNYKGSLAAPGYSYRYIGGDATYIIIPNEVMEMDCLFPYAGEAYFYGSLSEPMSCIVGGYHANYHVKQGTYIHEMGIREGGNLAILAGAGPMELGAIDYAVHSDRRPSRVVVTDLDDARLARAASIVTPQDAAENGVELVYLNTGAMENPVETLRRMTEGHGFDDVFVYAPVRSVVEMADALLALRRLSQFLCGTDGPFVLCHVEFLQRALFRYAHRRHVGRQQRRYARIHRHDGKGKNQSRGDDHACRRTGQRLRKLR